MLKSLQLEFIDGGGRWIRIGYAFAMLATACLLAMTWYFLGVQKEVDDWHGLIEHHQTKVNKVISDSKVSSQDQLKLSESIKFSREIASSLNFPWIDLFNALGKIKANDVVILEIDPNPKTLAIKLLMEAKNYQSMLAFVKTLSADQRFREVYLLNHKMDDQNKDKPIRFSVEAVWVLNR